MAEYVAGSRVEGGKVVEKGLIQTGRLGNLKAALSYGWPPIPFEDLMTQSPAEFYSDDAPYKYAQAWSMIHFLVHGARGKRAAMLREYVARLSSGSSAEEALASAFGREDLGALELEWLKYVVSLKS